MSRWLFSAIPIVVAATAVGGCTTDQMARNVYEGAKAYQDSLKTTPLGTSSGESKSYDEYERERKRIQGQGSQ